MTDFKAELNGDQGLRSVTTTDSINISKELFEKLYLSPENRVSGELRKTLGNPTPLCLAGFLVSSTPLACDLLGWRGAGGGGAASIPVYLFMGGMLQFVGGFLEFFLGNTFPFVVFSTLGGFWLSFGATLQPFYNAGASFSLSGNNAEGLQTPEFAASFGFWLLSMGILSFFYLVCSIRTNVVLFVIFFCLTLAFGMLTGAYWNLADGNVAMAVKCQTGGGALIFALSILAWYLLLVQLLASVDFPIALPVGDLSNIVKGRSSRQKSAHKSE